MIPTFRSVMYLLLTCALVGLIATENDPPNSSDPPSAADATTEAACDTGPVVTNGNFTGSFPVASGSQATLKCNYGYEPSDPDITITCSTGNWSEFSTKCTAKACDAGPVVTNGNFTGSFPVASGSQATLKCNDGYEPSDSDITITCSTGNWSEFSTKCKAKECNARPVVTNGNFTGSFPVASGSQATLTCNDGYEPSDSDITITCSTGNWSEFSTKCTAKECDVRPAVTNGNFTGSFPVASGSQATLKCNDGYEPSDSDIIITCSNGNWSEFSTKCTAKACDAGPVVTNGNFTGSFPVSSGSQATLKCNDGYEPSDPDITITCSTGNWSEFSTKCTAKECNARPVVTNGNFTGSFPVASGSQATLKCNDGYEPSDSDITITCSTGNWSEFSTKCTAKECKARPAVTNGNFTGPFPVASGSQATLKCNEGYEPSDSDITITCSTGKWSEFSTTCTAKECSSLDNLTNGKVTFSSGNNYRSVATFTCDLGYTLQGDENRTCQSDTSWNGSNPTCRINAIGYNTTCYEENPPQCSTHNAVCISGIDGPRCLCNTNYTRDDTRDSCDNNYNTTCVPDNDTCSTPHAKCSNMNTSGQYKCICRDKFEYIQDEDMCRPSWPIGIKFKMAVNGVHEDSLSVYSNYGCGVGFENSTYYMYLRNGTTYIGQPETIVCSAEQPDTIVNFRKLTAGTNYTIDLVLKLDGVTSFTNLTFSQNTRPQPPDVVTIFDVNETSMNITWNFDSPPAGAYDGFNLSVTPPVGTQSLNGNDTSYLLSNLTGGTVYNVSVFTLIGDLSSERSATASDCTMPARPHGGNVSQQEVESIEITYPSTIDRIDEYRVICSGINLTFLKMNETPTVLNISGLKPGTNYTFNISSLTCNKQSATKEVIHSYTKPGPPESVNIIDIKEKALTVTWSAPSGGVDSYTIWLVSDTDSHNNNAVSTNYTFNGLIAATEYTVHVQTVWRSLTSINETTSNYTAPNPPNVTNTAITETSLSFHVQNETDQTYSVFLYDTKNTNATKQQINPSPVFTDLVPGRLYRVEAWATIGGVTSLSPTRLELNTVPGSITDIAIDEDGTSSSELFVKWTLPEGDFDKLSIRFKCRSPNMEGEIQKSSVVDNSTTRTNCSGLGPGTFCTVNFSAQSGRQKGNVTIQNISKSTREEAPEQVSLAGHGQTSRSINIKWTMPLTPNGIIRKYRVLISDQSGECSCINKHKEIACDGCPVESVSVGGNCTQSTQNSQVTGPEPWEVTNESFTDNMETSFQELFPGRNYTVTIVPYTKCWGKETVQYIRTDEEVPNGPPQNVRLNPTSSTINVTWDRPKCEDITGIITNYTVIYNYTELVCGNNVSDHVTHNNITSDQQFVLHGIYAYHDYTFSIMASTEVGPGNGSELQTVKTNESAPVAVASVSNTTTAAYSMTLEWPVPCPANGIIKWYTVTVNHLDTSYVTSYITNSSDTHLNVTDLLPFRNYTFSIAAINQAGIGPFTPSGKLRTEVGAPYQISDLSASHVNSSSVALQWNSPSLYTGPTWYTVTTCDVYHSNTSANKAYGYNTSELVVSQLKAYWNYSFNVTTETSAGKNVSGNFSVRTQEDVPGKVTNVSLQPESDVTKPRTVTVSWNKPGVEDRNGIIKGFNVRYGHAGVLSLLAMDSNVKRVVLTDLSPGNLTVQISANTSIGEGTTYSKIVPVAPGAPLKIAEIGGKLLMQPSSQGVSDTERQISIMLPLKSFFCNKSNGDPVKWGLVVAQASAATDVPYNGGNAYLETKLKTYRKWSDVKNADVIQPYIPTPTDWNPCHSSGTGRSRRDDKSQTENRPFQIGSEGECGSPGPDGYCNGELAPGRSYRVRGFVCTEGGCTESEYSTPIRTDPDLTIPVVAGVSSGVVVIAVVIIVLTVMRRKQKGCFAKGDDSPTFTNTTVEDATEMKVKETKKHTFKPGLVQLAEFSSYVDKMHKDTDLLFSDAFLVLKENSPACPTTMAESQACRPKNRYTNIMAFDHSRVKLLPLDEVEGSDYINANYIPGYKSKRAYIATQGPLTATFDDFWRMIWEQNVGVIVMVTKLVEKGRIKCDEYWPSLGEPVYYGDLIASILSESTLPDHTLRVIELKLKNKTRKVRQFSFLKWPDMGCPDHPTLLLDFVKAVRNEYNPDTAQRGPMVVHCSAGVGRTGTFIAVDNLLQYVMDNDKVDIYQMVLEMRKQRCNMVQTEDQFTYIYECLKEFIMADDEEDEEEPEEDPVYQNTNDNVYENMGFQQNV